jgi:hypothetical protein
MSAPAPDPDAVAAEIEAHVGASGWDRPPVLFALVRAGQLAVDEPAALERLGLDGLPGEALVPMEQPPLPDGPLDEVLGRLAWPDQVAGCALSQEIVILPPSADGHVDDPAAAARHPERREARLVVAVLRGGGSGSVLRLRAAGTGPGGPGAGGSGASASEPSELLTGTDLAPNLAAALHATLE